MCFDLDASPPLPPVSGGALTSRHLVLEAADGNRFAAYEAHPEVEAVASIVVLPDVRGLFSFYHELAEQLASAEHHALSIDYFGRTAGLDEREADFPYRDHVALTTAAGVRADTAAAVAHLRSAAADRPVFTLGFCFGGSNAWIQAATGHGLAGAIGFYGDPEKDWHPGEGRVVDHVADMTAPILGLMGGDDPGIPPEAVARFETALTAAGVGHEFVTYPGAPHSFFDRHQEQFAAESADAWQRMLEFITAHS